MPQFLKECPSIKLTVQGIESIPDLDLYEADIMVHPFYMENKPNLSQHLVHTIIYGLYASKGYLDNRTIPTCIEDLDHHQLIGYGDGPQSPINWALRHKTTVIDVNSISAGIGFAKADMGIVAAPKGHPETKEANLIQLLGDIPVPPVDIYCSCLKQMEGSKLVQMFKDYLINNFEEETGKVGEIDDEDQK